MMLYLILLVLIIVLIIALIYVFHFIARGYIKANKLVKEKPILAYYETLQQSPSYCPLNDIPSTVKFVIICLEDICFFKHKGYNLRRIAYAFYYNLSHEKPIGGSTITQQLAKNMYLSFEKTYSRKITEYFIARKLEKTLSKEQILDIYLNIICYGIELYNIKDACEEYFQKNPSDICLNQAITLGCLLPAPWKYSPLSGTDLFRQAKKLALQRLVFLKVMKEEDVSLYMNASYHTHLTDPVTTNYMEQYDILYHRYLNNRKRIGTGL